MSVQYSKTHAIVFGKLDTKAESDANGVALSHSYVNGKHTWNDWHLIPSSRPVVSPPAPIVKTLSIPGRNGVLDISKILTGEMTYQNRTGSWDFIVDHTTKSWESVYREVMSYLHGQSLICVLEDDPAFYYEGRFSIGTPKNENGYSVVPINYDLYPFKRFIQFSSEPWVWDPFNFDIGKTNDLASGSFSRVSVSSGAEKKVIVNYPYDETILPYIYSSVSSGNAVVELDGSRSSLKSGLHQYPGIKLKNGNNTVTFTNLTSNTITVGIEYRGGVL